MDPSNPVIFDISSDDEPTSFDDMRSRSSDDDDGPDWLTELLENVDREAATTTTATTVDSSSDDVIVLGEYIPVKNRAAAAAVKSKSSSKVVKDIEVVVDGNNHEDDDDDDCVVLDCDPEKAVEVVKDNNDVLNNNNNSDGDDDDVLVVAQKGQIACRDYPHPRHLCFKYPFSSTPHGKHCELCHCYVCDSLAPCLHWGTGVSNVDHCHATDKQDMWKRQRESFRLGKCAPLPVSNFPDTHLPVAVPQNQVVPNAIQLTPTLGTRNRVSRPVTIRACSSARLSGSNNISQNRNQQPVYAHSRNGLLPCSVSQQAIGIGVRNNTVLRDRHQHFVSANTTFKRPGIIRGAVAMNQSVYGPSNNMNCTPASQYVRNAVPHTAANAKNTSVWSGVLPPNIVSDSYSYSSPYKPNIANVSVNTVPPISEPYSQPVSQSNDGGDVFQYANQSQTVVDPRFFDFDLGWLNNSSQSNQQFLAENVQHNDRGPNNEPTAVELLNSQFTGSSEHHHKECENWFLPDAVASEGCVPADLNVFSPEPSAFDAGMLCFDFETSWNGLAQV